MDAAYYQSQILDPIVKEYGTALFLGQPFTFQQDNAPIHTARTTQQYCEEEFSDFISAEEWPPLSPDLNPLDYCIRGIMEPKVNAKPVSSLDALRRRIAEEWDNLDMDIVSAAIDSWFRRICCCIRKRGGRFE